MLRALFAARPGAAEERRAEAYLTAAEFALWQSQAAIDRRHTLDVLDLALRLAARAGLSGADRRWLARLSLLHDVGKAGRAPGPLGRAAAVLGAWLWRGRLPLRGRWAFYRMHPAWGARELRRRGLAADVRPWVLRHHRPSRPGEPEAVAIFRRADAAR
jgi:hypothetical protein